MAHRNTESRCSIAFGGQKWVRPYSRVSNHPIVSVVLYFSGWEWGTLTLLLQVSWTAGTEAVLVCVRGRSAFPSVTFRKRNSLHIWIRQKQNGQPRCRCPKNESFGSRQIPGSMGWSLSSCECFGCGVTLWPGAGRQGGRLMRPVQH